MHGVELRPQSPPAAGLRARRERPSVESDALPQSDQAAARTLTRWTVDGGVVVHGDPDALLAVLDREHHRGRECRVAQRIGEGLLHEPVDGELLAGVCGRPADDRDPDGEAGGPDALHQLAELADPGLRGVLGRVPLVGPEDPEDAPHIGEGAAPGLRHGLHGRRGAIRSSGREPCGAVGQRDHHGEAVRDDVVHLPRDPAAFGGRSDHGLLIALAGQLLGPVDQRGEIAPAISDVHPGQGEEETQSDDDDRRGQRPGVEGQEEHGGGQCRPDADRRDRHRRRDGESDPCGPRAAVHGERVEGEEEGNGFDVAAEEHRDGQHGRGDDEQGPRVRAPHEQRSAAHRRQGQPHCALPTRFDDQHHRAGDEHGHEVDRRDQAVDDHRVGGERAAQGTGRPRQAEVAPGLGGGRTGGERGKGH